MPYENTFGFETVTDGLVRQRRVNAVFNGVASKYDIMNDAMSFGLHRVWKASLLKALNLRPQETLLDVAGGSADVALGATKNGGSAIVCDINPAMLAEGQRKAWDRGRAQPLSFVVGNAEQLPVAGRTVDAVTIAFGLRNVSDIPSALASMRRVLKPGGRFFCLEFSQVSLPWLAGLYDRYSFHAIPWLGEKIAGDRAAYQYLVESIRRFPPADRLDGMMLDAGFFRPKHRLWTNGVVALHSGWAV